MIKLTRITIPNKSQEAHGLVVRAADKQSWDPGSNLRPGDVCVRL